MPNRVKCGSCDSVFQVPDGFSGRRGKCPKCGAVMELPGVKAAPPKKRPADEPSAAPAVRKPPVKGVAPAAAMAQVGENAGIECEPVSFSISGLRLDACRVRY